MKYFTHPARCSLVALLLCLLPVSAGYAQDSNYCSAAPYDVQVDMWNLPRTQNSSPQDAIRLENTRDEFIAITKAVLNHINAQEDFESVSTMAGKIDPSNRGNIVAEMNRIRDAYCVRRGELKPNAGHYRVFPYTALIHPVFEKPYTFQIRGLHLTSKSSGTSLSPQLILELRLESLSETPQITLTGVSVIDTGSSSTETNTDQTARIREVRALVEQLGDAFNADNKTEIGNRLEQVLEQGKVGIFESRNDDNGQAIGKEKSAMKYINEIKARISAYGIPEVSFDVIDVYKVPPEELEDPSNTGEVYRATVLQHYMYEKAFIDTLWTSSGRRIASDQRKIETYMDSDYLAINVEFSEGADPVITLRRAGRSTFVLDSKPSGVDVAYLNGHNLTEYEVTTPLNYLLNMPLQYHLIELNNVWYEPETVTIPIPEKPEHLNGIVDTVTMNHKDAYLVLNVRPADRASALRYNIGGSDQQVESGNSITITPPELSGVPLPEERIESNNRWVDLTVTAPVFDNFEVKSDTVNWSRPGTREVMIDFPKGGLEISSTPDASTARITDPDGASVEETTLVSTEAYATLPGQGLSVQVSNGRCYQDDPEIDECRFHIPSEVETDIMIRPNELKRMHFDLTPFMVRDETNAGNISGISLTRDDQLLTVSYTIEDNKDRDRKYIIDFDMFDRNSGEKLADLDSQVRSCSSSTSQGQDSTTDPDAFSCIGNSVRPGTHYYTWDMSDWGLDSSDNYLPVLSMRRKGTCLPCILIPVAAGAAAAIIFPRTGSNEVPTFVPPPRPTETQNR